ncbi:MAG: CHASE2 domain-containing protein [Terriglobales bacterium]
MANAGKLSEGQRRFVRQAWVSAALVALIMIAVAGTRPVTWLENGTYDIRVRWSADTKRADPAIVIIDVDNPSFEALTGLIGRWPWTRRVWTETLRFVKKGQPRAVGVDVVFAGPTPDQPEVDSGLARVVKTSGNVVLAYSFTETTRDVTEEEKQAIQREFGLLEREARTPAGHSAYTVPEEEATGNIPLDEIAEAAAGLGCVNAFPDPDSKIRRTPRFFRLSGRDYASFNLRVAEIAAASSGAKLPEAPLDNDGNLLLQWHGPSNPEELRAYPRIPIWQVVCSIYPDQCPPEAKRYAPGFFKDKIVLIGGSTVASADLRPTPFAEQEPGVFIHATAIDNYLHGGGMRIAPRWYLPLAVVVLTVAGTFLCIRIASGLQGVITIVVVLAAYAAACYGAFAYGRLWLPLVAPGGALVFSYVSASAVRFATVGRELRRTRGTLDRYISPQLVDYVLENLETVELGGQKRELTILFSDVRNFTTLSEKSDPTELIKLLNEYLEAMTEIIFKHDGVVDKFIGDGILAYWGAFTPGKNHALLAARASLEMLERLEELNRGWSEQGRNPIAIGIGVNTGEVVFGNVGSGKKVEFTVIGDPVNLAARLEGQNKDFGTSIIISEFTRAMLGDAARVRRLGGVKVKGKTVETEVFELVGLEGGRPVPSGEPLQVKQSEVKS